MSLSLRTQWTKRLDAAQFDSSWQGQIEARVLRFLLSRYSGSHEEAPLAACPLFQGESPHGRAQLPLSEKQQRARLGHISNVVHEAESQPLLLLERLYRAHDVLVEERSHSPLSNAIKTFVAPHPVLLTRVDACFWFSLIRNGRLPR